MVFHSSVNDSRVKGGMRIFGVVGCAEIDKRGAPIMMLFDMSITFAWEARAGGRAA